MTRRWVDEWPDLEPVEVEKPHTRDMVLVIVTVGTVVALTAVSVYFGLAWLLGVL